MTEVYLIDESDRMILAPTDWSKMVLSRIEQMGHTVRKVDHNPHVVGASRSITERERVLRLIDETGL